MKKVIAIDGTHPVIRLRDRSVALQPYKDDLSDARPHAVVDGATAKALMSHEPGRLSVEDMAADEPTSIIETGTVERSEIEAATAKGVDVTLDRPKRGRKKAD